MYAGIRLDHKLTAQELAPLFKCSVQACETMLACAPRDCLVPNVTRCDLCNGAVDRFEHCFQCRKCSAFGDFNTGIMTRLDREYYQPPKHKTPRWSQVARQFHKN
jgi:hypothetical protein